MIPFPRPAAASCARRVAALSLVLVALLASSGCSSLLPSSGAAPVTYVLRPAIAAQATAPASAASSLQVQRVAVAPGYARDEVLLTQPDRRLDVYAASRWPDTLPVVMERLVVDALRQRGAWSVVHDAAAPFAADRLLRVTVRRFDAEYTGAAGPPTVRVVLDATLARRGDRARPGSVLVAGEAQQLVVRADATLDYEPGDPDLVHRPSVDVLFASLAAVPACMGAAVLLTGMGADGARGMLALRDRGWRTFAQDRASSVVWGMPGAADQIGAAERVLPVAEIGAAVHDALAGARP